MANRDAKLIERTLKDFSLDVNTNGESGNTNTNSGGSSQDLLYPYKWMTEIANFEPNYPDGTNTVGMKLKSLQAFKDFFTKYGIRLDLKISGWRYHSKVWIGSSLRQSESSESNGNYQNFFRFDFTMNNNLVSYNCNLLTKHINVNNYSWGNSGDDITLEMMIDRLGDQLLEPIKMGNLTDRAYTCYGIPQFGDLKFLSEPIIFVGRTDLKNTQVFENNDNYVVGSAIATYNMKDFFDLFEPYYWFENPVEE